MPDAERQPSGHHGSRFSTVQRVALAIVVAAFVWVALDLLLLLFVGVLLAVFLHTLASALARGTGLSERWSLLAVTVLLFGGMVLAGWLFAPRLAEQVRQLAETLPQSIARLTEYVRQTTFGAWALEQLGVGSGGDAQQQKIVERATGAARKLVDVAVALAIVLFTGLYLASAPRPYVRGMLRLMPIGRRRRAAEVLFAAGYTLRWWILGQLLSMAIVGVLMSAGLAIIGVPMALALGVLAGLFEFVPTVGPVLGLLPALLLAVAESPQMGVYVLVLYGIVQTVESYVLTPLVQERVIELPPVVTIATQVLFAWTLGPLGLLVAVPVVAVTVVTIQMLYVEDLLGDRMRVVAEEQGRKELADSKVLDGVPTT